MQIGNGSFLKGNCLELMKDIPDSSVDMILCDLPYGTTSSAWDTIIPFEPLWEQYWRIVKPNAAIVLTSAQPFTTALIASQQEYFRYCWYWIKTRQTGFQNAKKQPTRCVEDVCVFYKKLPTYNPQGVVYSPKVKVNGANKAGDGLGSSGGNMRTAGSTHVQEYTNYPNQILEFNSVMRTVHPTQKPVELFEYLIKTYTNEGELVLDNTAGSGTTAIAAEKTKRKWICMEMDDTYYTNSVKRVEDEINNNFDDGGLFAF